MGNAAVKATAPVSTTPTDFFQYPTSEGPWFKCEPDAVMLPRCSETGISSAAETPPVTMQQLFKLAAELKGDKPALKVERPCPALVEGKPPPALPDHEWTTWTFKQWHDDSRTAAKGFVSLGFSDSVNVWGFNAPEWMISAMAAGFAGGKIAGLYPTDAPETAAYKVVHSRGSIVVVEDKGKMEKLAKALTARGDSKRVKAFVAYGFEPAAGEKVTISNEQVPVISWKALMELGGRAIDEEIDRRTAALVPGECAALVYTSGTTGEPKAVMLSHDSVQFECASVWQQLSSEGVGTEPVQERILSYLPLSHVAGKMVDIAASVYCAARKPSHVTVYFARPYDLKVGAIKDRLVACKPTIFLGVPLVWEKNADKLKALGATTRGPKKALATWAKRLALEHAQEGQLGGSGAYPPGYSMANALVLKKIKAALGLDECKFGFTGAAPMRVDTQEYFGSLGVNINEIYGMSESCACCTWSSNAAHMWGSCGYQMPGFEVKAFRVDPTDLNKKAECPRAPTLDNIDEEFQGELCFRGRAIMMGYMANPDLGQAHVDELTKKTEESIDSDGWLHSGDKGMVTDKGMVKITGRYKEIIIGEGGENIAPVPIEDHIKKCCDGINEVMMIGDKRKYNVAVITLKAVGANGEVPGTDDLDMGAKRVNPEVTTISKAMDETT
ncbi:unnamed protein product [Polarella glacialis]|uniref:AMP-dependent synthetase/ligase domain-containing protein n=1 Tax=Polarella glacialis TaxID=89957 RepID=A0A813E9C6_POLGL|nr:unnamed protein product [Polarella glacialis]